jgi:pilus assembly protein TadC
VNRAMNTVAAAVAVAALVALLMPVRSADRRVGALFARSTPVIESSPRVRAPELMRRVAVLLIAAAVALFVGGLLGVLVGGATGVGVLRFVSRLEPAARRERRRAIDRDLPVALDLLSACLTSGAPLTDAIRAVGSELGGPLGTEFDAVTAALDLGVAPAEAWLALPADGFGSLGRTLARATASGAPLADVVAALADERRTALQTEGAAAARRAGVAVVGPLGLCFLPAFLCTAVVPVVVGLAARVLG